MGVVGLTNLPEEITVLIGKKNTISFKISNESSVPSQDISITAVSNCDNLGVVLNPSTIALLSGGESVEIILDLSADYAVSAGDFNIEISFNTGEGVHQAKEIPLKVSAGEISSEWKGDTLQDSINKTSESAIETNESAQELASTDIIDNEPVPQISPETPSEVQTQSSESQVATKQIEKETISLESPPSESKDQVDVLTPGEVPKYEKDLNKKPILERLSLPMLIGLLVIILISIIAVANMLGIIDLGF